MNINDCAVVAQPARRSAAACMVSCARTAAFSALVSGGGAAYAMDLGPTIVTSKAGQPLVAEVEVRNVKEKPTWTLEANSVSATDYANAGLAYAAVLGSTTVKLRRRSDGSRFLLVTVPQVLPAGVAEVLLNVRWDNNNRSQSYRLVSGVNTASKTAAVAVVTAPVAVEVAPPVAASVLVSPVSAPQLKPVVAAITQQGLQERVAAWALAWATQDVDTYLAFYDPSFESEGHTSRDVWERERRERIENRKRISVNVSAMVATVQATSGSVAFTQAYASGVYSDTVRKRLDFIERDGQLYITRETVVKSPN